MPLFLSEFGACLTEASCTQEISQVTNASDSVLAGWAYWQFKFFEDLTTSAGDGSEGFYNADGTLQEWKVKALARSYLMATQGVPSHMHFATETGAFTAKFTLEVTVDAPTIVYLNEDYWYPNGYDFHVFVEGVQAPSSAYTIDVSNKKYLSIKFSETSYSGQTITINVNAK